MLAAVAEAEAQAISMQTKEALKAYKARGGKLGSNHPKCRPLSQEAAKRGQRAGVAANQRLARDAYADLAPHLRELRHSGKSYRQIASALDAEGHTTRHGRKWNPVQVKRVLDRSRKEGQS